MEYIYGGINKKRAIQYKVTKLYLSFIGFPNQVFLSF
jgi:hypothetical protein